MNEKIISNTSLLKRALFYLEFLRFCRKKIFFDVTKHKTKCLTSYLTPLAGMYAIVKT